MNEKSNFDIAFQHLLHHEGGYSNHLYDPGGETIFGITKRTAFEHGYTGLMSELPLEIAKEIYKKSYWKREFDEFPFIVAFNIFDGAVNSGMERSISWLQSSVRTPIDGILGSKTFSRVMDTNPFIIVSRYNSARLNYLTKLPTWSTFGKGWTRRIAYNLNIYE